MKTNQAINDFESKIQELTASKMSLENSMKELQEQMGLQ
jgi:prefoldin subunit 5